MSFKLVDKIKKSNLPGAMKKVLEAYVSFGNADGTNIRPTADAVADRITGSRITVARYTPRLVRLGLLVHDRNEDGTYKTHSYNSTGTWAHVYHANLAPLSRPEITEAFDLQRQALSEKRQAAGRMGGRPKRQMELFDESNLLQSGQSNLLQSGQTNLLQSELTKLQHVPYPSTTQPKDYPSVVSTTESKQVSKQVGSDVSLRSTSTNSAVAESPVLQNLLTPQDPVPLEQGKSKVNPEEPPAHESRYWDILHQEFGTNWSLDEDAVRLVDKCARYENLTPTELGMLIRWALKHTHWKKRLFGIKNLAKFLDNGVTVGGSGEKSLVAQFRRAMRDQLATAKSLAGSMDNTQYGKLCPVCKEVTLAAGCSICISCSQAATDDSDPAADDTAMQVAAVGFEHGD